MDMDHDASPWGDVPSQGNEQPSNTEASQASLEDTSTSQTLSPRTATASIRGRGVRGQKRIVTTQAKKLDNVDDPMGALGPLGDLSSPPPADTPLASPLPPTQTANQAQIPKPAASSNASLKTLMGSVKIDDEEDSEALLAARGLRSPPPVQPPAAGPSITRQGEPSVNIVEAAKAITFHISVGDPHKVGDPLTIHTEYLVHTKTTSKAYRQPEFTVSRRFRDFLWLYNQLHQNVPGTIIPPPPEKQAVGRFNVNFVESRRQALERMLNKVAAHPALQRDADLKLFLESDSFNVDIKHRERREPLGIENKGGVLSSIGLGASVSKYVEHDDWFHERRIYLDALENQLRGLEKAVDTVITQRRTLSEACGEFSASLGELAVVEISPALSGPLEGLAEVQARISELYERQSQQDMLTLGITIDEYVRMIGSCKMAFGMREKSYNAWNMAENELGKKKSMQDKLLRQGRSQQDRLVQLEAEVADAEKRAHQARLLWDDMGRILRQELDRFEREKVEDFKASVETYLESAVEAQKELIEVWETYLMRLDAEDERLEEEAETYPSTSAPAQTSSSSATTAVEQEALVHADDDEEQGLTSQAPIAEPDDHGA